MATTTHTFIDPRDVFPGYDEARDTEATDRQYAFIDQLLADRNHDEADEWYLETIIDVQHGHTIGKRQASFLIDFLQSCPRRQHARHGATCPTEEGMYETGEGIFRVRRSQAGRLYAKTLDPSTGDFAYEEAAIYRLTDTDRMTLDRAREIGKMFGRCCVCGAELSDPKSVENGIGPICMKRV